MKIKHEDRFTMVEMFQMFQVDCDPHAEGKTVRSRCSDVKVPLWRYRRKAQRKGRMKAPQLGDGIREGVTIHPPGSRERIEDMQKFYATQNGGDCCSQ